MSRTLRSKPMVRRSQNFSERRTNAVRTANHGVPVSRGQRFGFTLIEMLVSVALVVLMMTLFATIFQMATGAMNTQKGLAENDQRSRLVLNSIRNDLDRRTMKLVLPFAANEDISQPEAQIALRAGYLYIREGNPDDDGDDMLQMTIAVTGSEEPFFGRWGRLNGTQLDPILLEDKDGKLVDTNGNFWPNQPELDDGAVDANKAASSPRAEVCYFLRAGKLYRRVFLIRQPSNPVGSTDGQPRKGEEFLNVELFEKGGDTKKPENFLACADFAAYFDPTSEHLQFHGAASLNNNGSRSVPVLAIPKYRFGHDIFTGIPREISSNGFYFGRFTHEETSKYQSKDRSIGFGYPGRITKNSPNPYDVTNTTVTYNKNRGVIAEYAGGERISEDVLMTNVLRFNIRVWDAAASVGPDGKAGRAGIDDDGNGLIDVDSNGNPDTGELGYPGTDDGDFRDLGHRGTTGFYRAGSVGNTSYSPVDNFRFDTWHPQVDLNGDEVLERPPFRAALPGPDGKPGVASYSDDGNLDLRTTGAANPVPDDLNELGWPGTDDIVVPLQAIQVTITFIEPTTRQLRDVSVIVTLKP